MNEKEGKKDEIYDLNFSLKYILVQENLKWGDFIVTKQD